MAVVLGRLAMTRTPKVSLHYERIRLLRNISQRLLSSHRKTGQQTNKATAAGQQQQPYQYQSFRDKRSQRMAKSNAASGWLVGGVAFAGGTISAVVMAYTEETANAVPYRTESVGGVTQNAVSSRYDRLIHVLERNGQDTPTTQLPLDNTLKRLDLDRCSESNADDL